jgi:hypothetical protein
MRDPAVSGNKWSGHNWAKGDKPDVLAEQSSH